MKRITFLKQVGYGAGATVLLPSIGLIQGCKYQPKIRQVLTESDIPFLDELGETIIPTSADSPGAKAAQIGQYMLLMYQDCMEEEDQQIFVNGINTLDNQSVIRLSSSFIKASPTERKSLLENIQNEAIAYNIAHEDEDEPLPHYFDILKGLTMRGYFTSEIGMTQARAYLPLPGKYVNCMPYSKSDKVWAL